MNRWYKVVGSDVDLEQLENDLSRAPWVLRTELSHSSEAQEFPDDESTPSKWELVKTQCPYAWNIAHGDSSIIVCTLDTGCDIDHDDLRSNLWFNSAEDLNGNHMLDSTDLNNIDDDGNGYIDDICGWDFFSSTAIYTGFSRVPEEDYEPRDNQIFPDIHGHGTAVAGIAAATTNNGLGVPSASWNVRNMSLRCGAAYVRDSDGTLSGRGDYSDFAPAVQYSVDNGARIISISWSGTHNSPFFLAIVYARQNNCLVLASAGNANNSTPSFPAYYTECVAVAATDENDLKTSISSYGTWVNISAPGQNILTTSNIPHNGYRYFGGTSSASPLAASIAALVLSNEPSLTDDALMGRLLNTADNINSLNPAYAGLLGTGRINAYRAVGGSGNPGSCLLPNGVCVDTDSLSCDLQGGTWVQSPCGFTPCTRNANGELCFERNYVNSGEDLAASVVPIGDCGFVVAGYQTLPSLGRQGIIMRVDRNGNPIWTQSLGGTSDDVLFSCTLMDSSHVLAVGTKRSGTQAGDGWAVCLTTDGDIVWERTYGSVNTDSLTAVLKLDNGTIILGGMVNHTGGTNWDLWFQGIDVSGTPLFSRTIGGASDDQLWPTILPDHNSGFVTVGTTYSYGAGNSDVWVLCCDTIGQTVWQQTVGTNGYEFGRGIARSELDSGLYVANSCWSPNTGYDACCSYLTSSGNLQWTSSVDDQLGDQILLGCKPAGNGLVLWGRSQCEFTCHLDGTLWYVNSTGNLDSTLYLGTEGDQSLSACLVQSDGAIVGVGRTSEVHDNDWYFARVGGCNPALPAPILTVLALPDSLQLRWSIPNSLSICGNDEFEFDIYHSDQDDEESYTQVGTTSDTTWTTSIPQSQTDRGFYRVQYRRQ
ncbi:MAG: S8 family serine peptidase [Calditrichaeota bacterium]|nr:S8 family serine peptidase [Calditrichota bacterium]